MRKRAEPPRPEFELDEFFFRYVNRYSNHKLISLLIEQQSGSKFRSIKKKKIKKNNLPEAITFNWFVALKLKVKHKPRLVQMAVKFSGPQI